MKPDKEQRIRRMANYAIEEQDLTGHAVDGVRNTLNEALTSAFAAGYNFGWREGWDAGTTKRELVDEDGPPQPEEPAPPAPSVDTGLQPSYRITGMPRGRWYGG